MNSGTFGYHMGKKCIRAEMETAFWDVRPTRHRCLMMISCVVGSYISIGGLLIKARICTDNIVLTCEVLIVAENCR